MADETPDLGSANYQRVVEWHAQKLSRDEMIKNLKADGLDDESANVLINSVAGRLPPELPEAGLTRGTNVLAPSAFSLSDVGLQGHPSVVGLYWMGFGAAILIALFISGMLTITGVVNVPDAVQFYALRVGGFVSMSFVAWGLFRWSQGVTIRRR
jgi:hypothetical protein